MSLPCLPPGVVLTAELTAALQDIANTFTITGDGVAPGQSVNDGSVDWTFSINPELIEYLGDNETITASYQITVDDDSVANGIHDEAATSSQIINITIVSGNAPPTITGGPFQIPRSETSNDSAILEGGFVEIRDIDRTDIVTSSRTLEVSGTSNRNDPDAPDDAKLLEFFQLDQPTILDDTEVSDTLQWTFNSDHEGEIETFDYLAAGETLILTYTIEVTDSKLTASQTVTIEITGTNDGPRVQSGNDTVQLIETDTTLSSSGDFTVSDADTANTVAASVSDVQLTGSFTTSGSTLPTALSDNNHQALIDMLDLTIAPGSSGTDSDTDHIIQSVDADSADPSTINWAFTSGDSGDLAFDFLKQDETLTLTYTITLQDDSGDSNSDSTTTTVAVTITGTNDSP